MLREAIEISTTANTINDVEHRKIDGNWIRMINSRKAGMTSFQKEAAEDGSVDESIDLLQYNKMLEMNSQLSKRFKLDERFAEDFEPGVYKKSEEDNLSSEANEEREKNIRILETVLGHEVNAKPVEKSFSRKRLIRYDPEDENASKYVKSSENTCENSKKKKGTIEEKVKESIPISTERYIEVCPNLKDILSTSTPFSFSQKFDFETNETALESQIGENIAMSVEEIKIQDIEKQKENKQLAQKQKSRIDTFTSKSKYDSFFVTKDDPRLKEGIEFFKIPKPLEKLRVEWQKRRQSVLELFKRKKKTSQQSYSAKVQNVQKKNMIRKHHFKK